MTIKRGLLDRISSGKLILSSFALVIVLGSILLMLPISSASGRFTPLLDAGFTATSATCVTGLIVFDTATHWSIFGKVVILILIQIGGLGLITFTTFFMLSVRKKAAMRNINLAKESVGVNSIVNIRKLVRMVVYNSLVIELIGMLLLATRFVPRFGFKGLAIAGFLAVSAFCNAGFDVLGTPDNLFSSLTEYNGDPVVLLTISALIVIGGAGFIVWQDVREYPKTRRLTLHTKVVLLATFLLVVGGTLLFMLFEWNQTLAGMPFPEKVNASIFQSVTCRTAGFNSVPAGNTLGISRLLMILLMFIGAAPGSTGGGIKVTTFTVIIMTVVSAIRGKSDTAILHRRVDKQTVYKSFAIAMLAIFLVAVTSGVIYFSEPPGTHSALNCVYEAVSAFGTVGISTGLTPSLHALSKIALMITMYLGRVGPVTFVIALTLRNMQKKNAEILPEGQINVG